MTTKLEYFLNELLQQVNDDTVSPRILSLLSELFITHEMEKKGMEINAFPNEQKEIMKYYTLGWFYYNNLIDSKKYQQITDDKININT